ncbi:MAG: hypothetical protein QOH34_13, partial [Mycobacterium sp.]|nr:hypothetical protein [Mycobacterium sp.]
APVQCLTTHPLRARPILEWGAGFVPSFDNVRCVELDDQLCGTP